MSDEHPSVSYMNGKMLGPAAMQNSGNPNFTFLGMEDARRQEQESTQQQNSQNNQDRSQNATPRPCMDIPFPSRNKDEFVMTGKELIWVSIIAGGILGLITQSPFAALASGAFGWALNRVPSRGDKPLCSFHEAFAVEKVRVFKGSPDKLPSDPENASHTYLAPCSKVLVRSYAPEFSRELLYVERHGWAARSAFKLAL